MGRIRGGGGALGTGGASRDRGGGPRWGLGMMNFCDLGGIVCMRASERARCSNSACRFYLRLGVMEKQGEGGKGSAGIWISEAGNVGTGLYVWMDEWIGKWIG